MRRGLVTAAGNGEATVTASAGEASGSAVVTVTQSVASVVVSPSTDELTALGETVQLTAEAFDGNGHAVTGAEFSWESSDPAVATVDGSGLVTGVAEGVAMITASSGGTTQSAAVTVNLVPTSMLKVSGDGQRGEAGSPLPDSLVTEVRDQGGTPIAGVAVSWSVSSGGGVIASSQDRTDEAGRAFAWWTLGDTEGDQTVTARAGAVDVVFTAEAIPRLQASLNPSSASIQVGQSADFALTISRGSPGEQEGWTCTSFDIGVASVQFTASGCRATGLAEGSTTISAAVSKGTDRVTAVALLEVREPPSAVRITSIEPAVFIESQSATIYGTGFSSSTSENQVTIGGLNAFVSSATATRITLTVPRADCLPPRQAPLAVSNPLGIASRSVGVTPPQEDIVLPAGDYRYTSAGDGCLQLPAGGEYMIGVTSTSESRSSLTPVSLSGIRGDPRMAATSAAATPGWEMAMRRTGFPQLPRPRVVAMPQPAGELERFARSQEWIEGWREAEARLRAREEAELARLGPPLPLSPPARTPTKMAAGEIVTLWAGSGCTDRPQVQAVVRFVGEGTVWLEDLDNPGESPIANADFESMDRFYVSTVKPIHERYIGELSDIDQNGRVLILLSANNGTSSSYVLGSDLYPVTQCANSNQAEIYYSRAPSTRSDIFWHRRLLPHEITHIIQSGARYFGDGTNSAAWVVEGGAELASLLVGYEVLGHGSRQNLGYAQVEQSQEEYRDDRGGISFPWYGWWGLDIFFGRVGIPGGDGRVPNAPEECTWLFYRSTNQGPCVGLLNYSMGKMVLRFALDRFGPDYPGGESALMRRLTHSPHRGFASLEEVSGWKTERILAEFYIALWGDGRPLAGGAVDFPGMVSWDLYDNYKNWPSNSQLQPKTSSSPRPQVEANIRSGSNLYFHWTPNGSLAPTSIRVTTPSGAPIPGHISVWAYRIR